MTIQYCSDLHLEFPGNKMFLERFPLQREGEVLILAGEVLPFHLHKKQTAFIDFVADNYEMVYWLPVIMNIMGMMRPRWLTLCWKNYAAMYGWSTTR